MSQLDLDEKPSDVIFNHKECRVVASLMEKELTVPDNYPLTLNSLVLACNQKSNREPVMALAEGDVGHICNVFKDQDIIKIDYGERAYRYAHKIRNFLSIDKKQQALLTVMMMRAPQTLNDFKARTARMVDFESTDEIKVLLDELIQRQQPFVKHLPKGPGQREDRYTHLLSGDVVVEQISKPLPNVTRADETVRIVQLEKQVTDLLNRVEQLEQGLV